MRSSPPGLPPCLPPFPSPITNGSARSHIRGPPLCCAPPAELRGGPVITPVGCAPSFAGAFRGCIRMRGYERVLVEPLAGDHWLPHPIQGRYPTGVRLVECEHRRDDAAAIGLPHPLQIEPHLGAPILRRTPTGRALQPPGFRTRTRTPGSLQRSKLISEQRWLLLATAGYRPPQRSHVLHSSSSAANVPVTFSAAAGTGPGAPTGACGIGDRCCYLEPAGAS